MTILRFLKACILPTIEKNKAVWATLRPDSVSACIDFAARHVKYKDGQMDGQTHKKTKYQKRLSKHSKEGLV